MGGATEANGGVLRSLSVAASRIRVDFAFALVDLVIVAAAYSFGLVMRLLEFSSAGSMDFWWDFLKVLPAIVLIHLFANALAGAYGHVWEYASMSEAVRLAIASAGSMSVIIGLALLLRQPLSLHLSIVALALGGLVSFLLMGLVRFRSRLFSHRKVTEGPRTVVVGSGKDAVDFARRSKDMEDGGLVVGFVGDGNGSVKNGVLLADLPVLGPFEELSNVVQSLAIDQVVVATSDPSLVKAVVDACIDVEVRLRIIPGVEDVLRDKTAPLDLRDIKVDDLLQREPVETDLTSVAELLGGKRVLVTGAGGSIGSEIVRQVMGFEPEGLWALDRDETLLHDARLQWASTPNVILADVRDADSLLRVFERVRPDVVFHAAALKHVPVLENHPEEAVLANVIGTRNVIEAGSRVGVQNFVLISTDKAVDPSSVMGATKRVAELLVKAGNERNDGCSYTAVRFGNVLGSRGSVIPTFVSQIRAGGPVTVTDPEMTRYFMTIDEAVQLVLQAAGLARDSEVFLLDMGEPVRIEHLAKRLIRLAGLIPGEDIEIVFTGARPGEKLCEELANGPVKETSNPKIFEVPLTHPGAGTLAGAVVALEEAANSGDTEGVRQILGALAEGAFAPETVEVEKPSQEASASWS